MQAGSKYLKISLYHIFVIILGVFMLYPVLWMLASSLKDNSEIYVHAESLIPRVFKFSNYADGWKGFGNITFLTFFKNSFIITILGTIGNVISSLLVAYGFSRVKFALKKVWFFCMMVTMMLPSQVLLIPQYIMYSKIGWVNTFKPLIVPSFLSGAFFVFMIMQFIQGIPIELDESAKIDGCGKLTILIKIILPLLKPVLVTSIIFSFYWRWEDFFTPLLYLNTPRKYPVAYALCMFADPNSVTNWGAMFAMSTLSLVPVIAVFVCFQKYLVEGISTTGIKA